MKDLLAFLVAELQNDAALQTLLGGTVSDKKIYPSITNAFENFPCVTYDLASSSQYTVPVNNQVNEVQLHVFTKTSKDNLEQITDRINTVLNYDTNATPRVYWMVKRNEVDQNETDRQLYTKVIRYIIWTKI